MPRVDSHSPRTPHGDAFAGAHADAHATPARRRTAPGLANARAFVAACAARTASSPWRVDRSAFTARLARLVAQPDVLQQRRLNLCGPAAFLRAWAMRDPAAFAAFAAALYDDGHARIGPFEVRPSPGSLIAEDYAALAARHGGFPEAADWLMMGALRDSENAILPFHGRPDDTVSGMTFPREMARWLRACGCYEVVADETSPLVPAGMEYARSLRPDAATDVFLLLNLHVLRELRQPTGRRRAATFLTNAFPDHWAVLAAPVEERPGGVVGVRVWSWGMVLQGEVAAETWRANFYGAVVARVARVG
ncbi:MAG: hypothetical protein ABI780_13980 [Ardenticatenales bacterium]